MGHSASIAKKYQATPNGRHGNVNNEEDDHDSLATVSSYRPISPQAHSDAQQFTFGAHDRPPSRNGHIMNGTLPNGSLSSRRNISSSSSTLGNPQLRSMRDVNHFLVRNPELLTRKKAKSVMRKNEFDEIMNQKQIKTKQDLYLGLFNPPTIYGKGVDPDKQLKINQRMYLQLIHPTYGQQCYKPYRPLVPDNMIVVRKDDYMRKPSRERTRPPLKGMEVIRASPSSLMIPQHHSRQHQGASHRSLPRSKSPHIPNGQVLPTSTPAREISRRGNEYVDIPSSSVQVNQQRLSKLNPDLMEVERRFEASSNSLGRSSGKFKPKIEEEITFDYSVEDLGLKKKTRGLQQSSQKYTMKESVEPLYFRKSLAYNPRYSPRGNVLSDPL